MKIFLHLRFSLLSETWQGDIGAYMRGGWLLFMILTLMPYQYLYWDLGGKKDKGRVTENRYCQHNLLGGKLTIYSIPFQIWPLKGYYAFTYVWYGCIALCEEVVWDGMGWTDHIPYTCIVTFTSVPVVLKMSSHPFFLLFLVNVSNFPCWWITCQKHAAATQLRRGPNSSTNNANGVCFVCALV